MTCYHPLEGWRARRVDPITGRRAITFRQKEGYLDLPVSVACGQCLGCRLDRAQDWATRCVHEASLHLENAFVTLTYSDDNLPAGGSLSVRDLQLFFKRLRKSLGARRVGYLACGEYGEQLSRPHYHAIIFNYWPEDARHFKESNGHVLFTSKSLDAIWGKGFAYVGTVTNESSGYVARYVLKKVNGSRADTHYRRVDPATGELCYVRPEFLLASKRPAIGRGWVERYASDLREDGVPVAGELRRVPKYYRKRMEVDDPVKAEALRLARIRAANHPKAKKERTPERLAVRQEVKSSRVSILKRT